MSHGATDVNVLSASYTGNPAPFTNEWRLISSLHPERPSMTQDRGILSFGAYLPWRRLQRKAIASANTWFNPGLKGQAKGERAIANWDEDTVTMSVEAARQLQRAVPSSATGELTLVSTTLAPVPSREGARCPRPM